MMRVIKRANYAIQFMHDRAEEMSRVATWAWNMDTNEFVNSVNLRNLTGSSFGKGKSGIQQFIDKIHLQDRAIVSELIITFVERDEPVGVGYRIFRADGQERFFSTLIDHIRNDEGHRVVVAAIEDMGNHLSAERYGFAIDILRASEEKYRLIFSSIDEGFVIGELLYNKGGQPYDMLVLEANGRFHDMLSVEDATGKTACELFPLISQNWFEKYHEVVTAGKAERFQHFFPSLERWFELYLSRVGEDGSRMVAIVFNDVTERKQLEERQAFLLEFSDALRPLGDAVAIQHAAMGLLGRFLGVSRAYYTKVLADGDTMLTRSGYCKDVPSMVGSIRFSSFGVDIHRSYLSGEAVVINDVCSEGVFSESALATFASVQVRAGIGVPLVKDGLLLAMVVVHQSTPRQWTDAEVDLLKEVGERTWAAVQRADAEEAKVNLLKQREEFIGIVSHELKTPVTSIGLYAEVVKESLRERNDDVNADLLDKLGVQVGRLNHLISNLLDVTRIEEGKLSYKMEYFDLNVLLFEQLEEIRHIAGRRTISLSTGEACYVMADKQRITQVIINLLSNAIKYSPEGTSVRVISEVQGLAATVSVGDSGIGISAQSIPKIFDRFYRADSASKNGYAGLGLGLYISSEIIRNHGGNITVSSVEGEGSVFRFILPLEKAGS